jgi:hypothetical protein
MIRTQLQLPEDQFRRLKVLARQQGISLAEIVRRCVAMFLSKEISSRRDLYARASKLEGAFEDREGSSDTAIHHDRYLDDDLR